MKPQLLAMELTNRSPDQNSLELRKMRIYTAYSPPKVDRIWGVWGPYYNIPKAIFYLLKGDYRMERIGLQKMY